MKGLSVGSRRFRHGAQMSHHLDRIFRPRSVVFIGGSNLKPVLRYHRDLGFDGITRVVSPRYDQIEGFACTSTIEDLPEPPDLAFVAIRREYAIEAIEALRQRGCGGAICNAAGFAETGAEGAGLQDRLKQAAGDMALLGPNAMGLVNFADPLAAMMDHFGVSPIDRGVAVISQGGGFLCDAVFADRGLPFTHLVGVGNQAVTGLADCMDYLLDDPRVTAIGLSFEGLPDVAALRRAAARALDMGKPVVAIKFGRTAAGAHAARSHTASMTGEGAAWDALFDRLGIVSTRSESEFFETLKLFDSGQLPKGRRVMVTSVSGVMGVMLADHLSVAGFDLPQPTGARADRLRDLLPGIATPCNPQDVTMAAWNNRDQQQAIYGALLDEGYDAALMVQNYPREGMWDVAEYDAQIEALARACAGRDIAGLQLAPMADCFPDHARRHTRDLGFAPMQGLEECISALGHALWWRERRADLVRGDVGTLMQDAEVASTGAALDEAEAKKILKKAGLPVPASVVCAPQEAAVASGALHFPQVLKAVDARLLHKTEVGAVRVGLNSEQEVADAVADMRRELGDKAPHIRFERVLVEEMAPSPVAEFLVSVSHDAAIGPVMMIAGGGIEAELWNDSALLAAPFTRVEIERAVDRLKVARKLDGWRGNPAGDRAALLDALEKLAEFAVAHHVHEVEINPIMVGTAGAWVVDAVLRMPDNREAGQAQKETG